MIHMTREHGLSDLTEVVKRTVADLRPHVNDFDSIVTEGISGLVVAAPVAVALGKELVIVRKADDGPRCWHASEVENAQNAGRRTLFIDDEIQRGRTIEHVKSQLRAYTSATVAATYEYADGRYTSANNVPDRGIPNQRGYYSNELYGSPREPYYGGEIW